MRFLHKNNFPPETVNHLMSAYFHLGMKKEFERLGQTILENKSNSSPLVILTCKMDINSLKIKEGEDPVFDPEDISQEMLKQGDLSLALKASYGGILADKTIVSKEKISQFILMAKLFRKMRNFQDASRAQTEAALIMFDRLRMIKKTSEKEQALKNIKLMAANILKDASRVNYTIGIICGLLIKWLTFKARKELIVETNPNIDKLSKDRRAIYFAMSDGEEGTAGELQELMKISLYIPPKFSQYSQLERLC
jgi:hypothetical protein